MLCRVVSYYIMLCCVVSCYVVLCRVLVCGAEKAKSCSIAYRMQSDNAVFAIYAPSTLPVIFQNIQFCLGRIFVVKHTASFHQSNTCRNTPKKIARGVFWQCDPLFGSRAIFETYIFCILGSFDIWGLRMYSLGWHNAPYVLFMWFSTLYTVSLLLLMLVMNLYSVTESLTEDCLVGYPSREYESLTEDCLVGYPS